MRMSTENSPTEAVEPAGQVETENGGNSDAPEWMQKELDRARKEAAKYRERSRQAADEAETKLRDEFATRESDLKKQHDDLTEKYEDLLVQANEKEHALTKLRLAVEHGIPADNIDTFTKRLVGETQEELAEDAKQLAGFFGSSHKATREDHSQGSGAVPLNSPTLLNIFERKFGKL